MRKLARSPLGAMDSLVLTGIALIMVQFSAPAVADVYIDAAQVSSTGQCARSTVTGAYFGDWDPATGTCRLSQDVVFTSSSEEDVYIMSSNTTLDCNGHSLADLSGNYVSEFYVGIDSSGKVLDLSGVAVENCTIQNFISSLYIVETSDIHISNNRFLNDSNDKYNYGGESVLLSGCQNAVISNNQMAAGWFGVGVGSDFSKSSDIEISSNTITDNVYAFNFYDPSTNVTVFNNLFKNNNNFFAFGPYLPVAFDTTLQPGKNIVGGNLIGGNAYLSDDHTGYSETCADANHDGICDKPYTLPVGGDPSSAPQVDYYPLAANIVHAPVITASAGGPYQANEGDPITFDGSGSSSSSGGALTLAWDFGDGSTGTGVNPSHTYSDDGAYTVTLTVTDSSGATASASTTATILNVAPTVSLDSIDSVILGNSTQISGSFTDPGSDTWTATIDYGDGTGTQALALSGKSFSVSHEYDAAGTYRVTVTVSDDDGGAGSAQLNIDVVTPADSISNEVNTIQDLVSQGQISQANRSHGRNGS